MKALLMHPERDFFADLKLPANEVALTQDLELETLWSAMAAGDPFLFEVSKRAVLASLTDPDVIRYRQQALVDCLDHPDVVRSQYALAGEALEAQKRVWRGLGDTPTQVVHTAVAKLEILLAYLEQMRDLSETHRDRFGSGAFTGMFTTLASELGGAYLATVKDQLSELQFPRGMLISAELGEGNKGRGYLLRKPRDRGFLQRLGLGTASSYSFSIPERDHAGFEALSRIENEGLNAAAGALGQATEHVVAFFRMFRTEVGFYVACLNLHERLAEKGEPICFPAPLSGDERTLAGEGLYDPCLSLKLDNRVTRNDVSAAGKSLIMITGANQGGKSTLLRAAGVAQLMMQCGMFVCAESFTGDCADGVFTHFKREEDEAMESGKLDEELARMSEIADTIGPGCTLLCNESFASTNEREGSEIARQVIRAMVDAGVRVVFVTHLFDLAHSLYEQGRSDALFLRAERRPDGTRTFRLHEGEPLPTSYGADSYRLIFGAAALSAGSGP